VSFYKLNLKVDPLPLQIKLKENPCFYGKYDYRSQGSSPHREMTDIWVRTNDLRPYLIRGDLSGFTDKHDPVWYPIYSELQEITPIVVKIINHVEGEAIGAILITKLPSGGKIYPHVDEGWNAGHFDKFYVPVENYKGATFNFNNGHIDPEIGCVYQFDNSKLHWVNNNSDGDRVAMIVCVRHKNQPRYKEGLCQ